MAMDDSQSLDEYGFNSIKNFTKDLVNTFVLGDQNARFSVVAFAENVKNVITHSHDSEAVIAAIHAQPRRDQTGVGTNIGATIDRIIQLKILGTNAQTATVPKVCNSLLAHMRVQGIRKEITVRLPLIKYH